MIALFVLKLSVGVALMWWLMPRKEVTDGFFRIQMRVLLGLAVLIALLLAAGHTWSPAPDALPSSESANSPVDLATANGKWSVETVTWWIRGLAIAAGMISYAGSIFWALGRRLPGNLCIHLLTALLVVALGLHSVNVPNQSSIPQQLLADFSSAAVLGSVMTAMLLGHWYLTTPTMSINPLWWFNYAILASAVLRLAASGWAAVVHDLPGSDATQTIWLSLRWLGGIVAPILVVMMVWRILKHRNTQSATGVFFAGLIVVFMGEMTAALLERDTLIPF